MVLGEAATAAALSLTQRARLLALRHFLLKDAQNLNFAIAAEEYWR
jgi:hypothetical protein